MTTSSSTEPDEEQAIDIEDELFDAVHDCLRGIGSDSETATWLEQVNHLRERLHRLRDR